MIKRTYKESVWIIDYLMGGEIKTAKVNTKGGRIYTRKKEFEKAMKLNNDLSYDYLIKFNYVGCESVTYGMTDSIFKLYANKIKRREVKE